MFEYLIFGAGNVDPNVLKAAGAWLLEDQWVISADNKREAEDALINVGIHCKIVKIN